MTTHRQAYAQAMYRMYYGFIRRRMREVSNPDVAIANQAQSRSPYARAAAQSVLARRAA